MTDDKLKENFIKYFGEEKWDEETMLGNLFEFEQFICDYLDMELIPIIVEEMVDDSRFYVKEGYIAISKNCIKDKLEAAKCLAHELRHVYQMICVASNDPEEPLRFEWEKDFKNPIVVNDPNNQDEYTNYLGMTIELDAFAFQKFMVKEYYGVVASHASLEYDMILDLYINKHFKK